MNVQAVSGCPNPSDIQNRVREKARSFFNGAARSHSWDHTLRVLSLARGIARAEGADPLVVHLAALLHDIARPLQDDSAGALCHAREGARLAGPVLEVPGITDGQRQNVIHCIKSHRFRSDAPPETLEARVLFDADKLDSIGAIGIARTFQFAGEVGARLHNPDVDPKDTLPYGPDDTGFREYSLKLSKVRGRMQTGEGKRLARARHDFMEEFFRVFLDEHKGIR